jgi:hypothetical protein
VDSYKWGNPFVIGKHGDRDDVIRKFEEWVCYCSVHVVCCAACGVHCNWGYVVIIKSLHVVQLVLCDNHCFL